MSESKLITVVCYANYCRSPVAEILLKDRFKDKLRVTSAGISPLNGTSMDKRSEKFLKRNNLDFDTHIPKGISSNLAHESSLFLALDHQVLMMLNKKNIDNNKIKLITYQNSKILLPDPFRYDDKNYNETMDKIKNICMNIDLDYLC